MRDNKIRSFRYNWIAIFVLAAFPLLISTQKAAAQDNAVLRIIVISEEDGNPVIGANSMLLSGEEDEKKEIEYAGATNKDGLLEFRGVEPGRYQLKVSYIGHETYREELSLTSSSRLVKQVTLSSSIEQMEEVVVEGERGITTGEAGLNRISTAEVGRIPTPGTGGDLASYLQTLPGVISSGDRGGDLHIRGGTPSQNHVLIDNLPVVKPFHISNLFSAFPEEIIQSVDMYAGGFGAEYMGATSAVMDVSIQPGNMKEFSGSAAVSPYLFSLQAEGPLVPRVESFNFMGRISTIEQTSPHLTKEETPINFYDLTGRYSIRYHNFSCNITGMYTNDRGQINPYRNVQLAWSNMAIGGRCLGYDERFNYPFEITLGYTGYNNSEGPVGSTERESGVRQLFLKLNHEEELFGMPFKYGGGLSQTSFTADLSERFTSVESFREVAAIVHFYGSTLWNISDQLAIHPSVGTQFTLNNSPTFEPRLRASYRPSGTDRQEFSLALGRYYQISEGISDERDSGTVFTIWRPTEEGDPMPSALHAIAGYQQRLGNHLTFNIEGYTKSHSNIPVSKWTPEAKLNIETALAEGTTYGFDGRVEYNRNPLHLFFSYGWSKVEYEAGSEELGAWIGEPVFNYSPAHDQRHKLNTTLSYRFAGFTTSASWEFGSGKPFTRVYGFDLSLRIPDQHPLRDPGTARTLYSRPYGERLPVYHRLDVSLERSFQLSPQVSLDTELGVINTYDRENIFYFDLNTLQRVDQTPLMPYLSLRTTFN